MPYIIITVICIRLGIDQNTKVLKNLKLPVLVMKEFNLFQYLKAPQQFGVVFPKEEPVSGSYLAQTCN